MPEVKSVPDKWEELIRKAAAYRKEFSDARYWPVYRNWYRGIYTDQKPSDLSFDLVFGQIRAMVPRVYFRNPYFMVSPRFSTGGIEEYVFAKLAEALDNWLVDVMGIKRAMKKAILHAALCGRGILKVGFDSEYGFSSEDLVSEDATLTQLDSKRKRRIEHDTRIFAGMPWVKEVDPDFFLVPFGASSLTDIPWVDHIILRPIEDVRSDTKYKNTDDITGTMVLSSLGLENKSAILQRLGQGMEVVELHEIRDAGREEIIVLAPQASGSSRILRGPEDDELQMGGVPFSDITFTDDPEYYWCAGDASHLAPQQREMNGIRNMTAEFRKRAILRVIGQRGALNEEEKAKMTGEALVAYVESDMTPSTAFMPIQLHIPQELHLWAEQIKADAREVMGMGRQQLGEMSGRHTAKEATIVQEAHEIRMDERRDAVADCLCDVMEKVNRIIFKFWSDEQVVRLVGPDLSVYWVKFRPSELADTPYRMKVDVQSMASSTKALRRQEISQLMQSVGQNPMAQQYLLQLLLREFDWVDTMAMLPQAPESGPGNPMTMGGYTAQHQNMMQNPQVAQARSQQAAPALEALLAARSAPPVQEEG